MDKNKRILVAAGAAAAVLVVVLLVLWRVSASRAESRATELVSATADMVRCVAGEDTEFDVAAIQQGFDRSMVAELPDVSTVGQCSLALEVVQEKWSAYDSVWFSSASSKGEDGKPLGQTFSETLQQLAAVPFKTPSDQVFRKPDKHKAILGVPALTFTLHATAQALLGEEGADETAITAARETRNRKARKTIERAPAAKVLWTVEGRVNPLRWGLVAADKDSLTFHALTENGDALIGWSDDTGLTWKVARAGEKVPDVKSAELRVLHAPGDERWFAVTKGTDKAASIAVGKVADAAALPKPEVVAQPPEGWTRSPGLEREVVVLAGGVKVFPVWKIVEKTKEEKKEEEKRRKEWDENFADKAVQALMTLNASRIKLNEALGIDEDHKRVDGLAYAQPGGEVTVLELTGFGVGGLVPGSSPMALLGKEGIPALELAAVLVPKPGEQLGPMAEASTMKPVQPAFQSDPWLRCASSDGTFYGTTESGTFLIGMRPGSLELVLMTATADPGSHMGCGMGTAAVSLPFLKDRIFATILTIRLGEIEGGRVATTAGTVRDRFNETASTTVVPGAVMAAWVAEGFVPFVISQNWGTEYQAPRYLAEAGKDGSKITGVHLAGMGNRVVAMTTRESCKGEACTTAFELLVSDDAAKTWQAPK